MPFTAAEVSELVDKIGIISVTILVLLMIFYLLVRANTSGQERFGRMSEENQAELIKLRQEHDELEIKFTKCREAVKELEKHSDVSDVKKQQAIDKLLDDTQDLDRELIMLNLIIKDKDEIIRDKNLLIEALQKRLEGYDLND